MNISAKAGIIGNSNFWSIDWPEDFPNSGIKVIQEIDPICTPFGESAPLKLVEYQGHPLLYVGMHGCYPNDHEMILPPWAAQQLAWIFKQAGVKWVLTGGSVGGIQTKNSDDLPPGSVIIPDDIFMWQPPVITQPDPGGRVPLPNRSIFYRMAQPFCPVLSQVLHQMALNHQSELGTIQLGGTYTCTPWGRFETAAEIAAMKQLGLSVVGQTVGWEALALRDIPIGAIDTISNFAESTVRWCGETSSDMAEYYWNCAQIMGTILNEAIAYIFDNQIVPSSPAKFALTGLEQFPVPGHVRVR